MKNIKSFKLFEAVSIDDKYLINVGAANHVINLDRWVSDTNIPQQIKNNAINWSLYTEILKVKPLRKFKSLTNKEIGYQITGGYRSMRENIMPRYLVSDYKNVSDIQIPFHRLFNKFKALPIEKKIQFLIELEHEDYILCKSSDIIKVVDGKDLEEEIETISSKLRYFLEE